MHIARIERRTEEVKIDLELNIEGRGEFKINTGIGFLNHMLSLFTKHGLFDMKLTAKGDLEVDLHHTNEDVGIVLGEAFYDILKEKRQIKRFGTSFICMDEALVRCVVDISGRSYLKIKPKNLRVKGENYTYSYFKQFLKAFIDHSKISLHLDILEGEDFHHILEACFKALGVALKEAVSFEPRVKGLPTTKGKID